MNSNMRRSMAIGLLVAGALATGACSRGATAGGAPVHHRGGTHLDENQVEIAPRLRSRRALLKMVASAGHR